MAIADQDPDALSLLVGCEPETAFSLDCPHSAVLYPGPVETWQTQLRDFESGAVVLTTNTPPESERPGGRSECPRSLGKVSGLILWPRSGQGR